MIGKPYCWECGCQSEYCDCDLYDALGEDDNLLDENRAASAIEAQRAETLGSVHESAVPDGETPKGYLP